MSDGPRYRHYPKAQITARHLADYMAAGERVKRTIVRDSQYRPTARVIQHDEAKLAVTKFLLSGERNIASLNEAAARLRNRLADDPFERDLYDHNADYIDRFAQQWCSLHLPVCEFLPAGKLPAIVINGTKVTVEYSAMLKRNTRNNKIKIGALSLRYLKAQPLKTEVGLWQSAFTYGYLGESSRIEGAIPERELCLTLDVLGGVALAGPSNSVTRYNEMKAACASIAERWPNVAAPPDA